MSKRSHRIFLVLLILLILVITSVILPLNVGATNNSATVYNMVKIYQLTRSYQYNDNNVLSYTVEWYYASGYVNDQLFYFYAGFVREIPDASNGNANERWYVEYFNPKFNILNLTLNLYDIDPGNPVGCIESLNGGVSAFVEASRNGPSVQIGVSYSFTVSPYKLSIDIPNTYPEAHWIFQPCSTLYGSTWKGEATIMYVTSSPDPIKIEHLIGAMYAKEVRQCFLLCWWEYEGSYGHYHLWEVTLSPP